MMRGPLLLLDTCTVDLERLRVFRGGQPGAALSAREASLLRALAAADGGPVDRETLATTLEVPGRRAVDHAVRRLRAKLEADPRRPVHIVTVHGVGYALHERRVDEGGAPAPATSRWLRLSACKVDLASRVVVSATGTARLSPTEASLLAYLAARPGQPVEREELLAQVWGYRSGRTNTLATTLRRLRRKVCRDPSRPVNLVTRGRATVFVPPAAESERRGRGFVVRRRPLGHGHLLVHDPARAQQRLQDLARQMQRQLDDDDLLATDIDGVTAWCTRSEVALGLVDRVEVPATTVVCSGDVVWLPAAEHLCGPAPERARALMRRAPEGAHWVGSDTPELAAGTDRHVPLPSLGAIVAVSGSADPLLIGRGPLRDEVASRLAPGALATLVGPAGAGKTLLAESAARRHGAHLRVELAPLSTSDAVVEAVERGLGAAFDPQLDRAGRQHAAGRALGATSQTLVVLDNAEHLRDTVRTLVEAWRPLAPHVCWLVTSRTPTGLDDEVRIMVPPLAADDAVLLLAHHAGWAGRPWMPAEAAALRRLADRVDALPLALVLAGRVVRQLGPEAADRRIATGLELSGGEGRHRSVAAALDTTWALLSDDARTAATQLCAYAGVVPYGLAGEIVPAASMEELVAHSVVTRDAQGVRMLVSVAAYMATRGDGREVVRHAEAVVGRATEWAQQVHRHGGAAALRSLASLSPELDRVVERAEQGSLPDHFGVRALLARYPLHQWNGGVDAAERFVAWAERAGPSHRDELWLRAGELYGRGGDRDQALATFARGLELTDDEAHEARLRASRGLVRANDGDLPGAESDYLASIRALDATGQSELAGRALGNLGLLRWWQGRLDDARACYDDALHRLRAHGSMAYEAVVMGNRAILEVEARRMPEAAAAYEQVLVLHRAMGNVMFEGVVSGNLADVWEHLGQSAKARATYQRALHLHRLCGDAMSEGIVLGNLGQLLLLEGDVSGSRDVLEQSADILVDAPPLYATLSASVASLPAHAHGDLHDARALVDRAIARLGEVGALVVQRFTWARAACIYADLGELAAARDHLARAEAVDTLHPLGAVEAARAHLARATGDGVEEAVATLVALLDASHERDPRLAWLVFEQSGA